MDENGKSNLKTIIAIISSISIPAFLFVMVIMTTVMFILGLFEGGTDNDSTAQAGYTIVCQDDAAKLLAKMLYLEVNGTDTFTKLTTAAVIINNAGGTSYEKIYSLTDSQYHLFSSYKDTPFEEYVPEGSRGELLYIAQTVLSGEYTLPSNIIYQASESIVKRYGDVWTSIPATPKDVYFGYTKGQSLSSTDILGNTLPSAAYSSVDSSVSYYKNLADSLKLSDYSSYTASSVCKKGGSGECGFTISQTSLSKSEYKNKVQELANSNSGFKPFADNADDIYDYAVSKKVNPELVVIRAYVEGHGKTTGTNNYWGLGCTNESQGAGCYSWSSFEEGYTYFVNVVSKYDSLASMMSKYAYIGKYWYTLDTNDPDGDGGCYYAPYIYPDNMPARVKTACAAGAPSCVMNGDTSGCTPTTDEDQKAYATWQVKKNMAAARKQIFGLEYDEGPCTGGTFNSLSSYTLKHEGLNVLNRQLNLSEISNLNTYINQEVDKAQYGTGAGVAAAGQSLTYGLEQLGYYLQYYWGGGHGGYGDNNSSFVGVNVNWGSTAFGSDGHYASRIYFGMDCSGFVSWAIRTACNPKFGASSTGELSLGKTISVEDAKPGDLMLNSGSHVRLVIKNNGDGTVIVAEESGGSNGLIFNKYGEASGYNYIDMSSYYSKNCQSSR